MRESLQRSQQQLTLPMCTNQSSALWPQLGAPWKIQTRFRGPSAEYPSSHLIPARRGPCRARCDNSMLQWRRQLGGAPTPTCMYSSRRLSCTQLLLRCLPPSPQLLSVSLARPPSLSSSRMRPAARYCVLYPSNVRLCSGLSLRSPTLPARAQKILTPAGGFCNLQASFWNARRRLRKNG